jgi:predicted dehydrogenase
MRCVIVGLGVQGRKRRATAGDDVVATVDPVAAADYVDVRQVPVSAYDAALVCTPDDAKLDLLEYLLGNGKHVLVEKPLLAADESRLRALAMLARRHRVACYTAYNHRFEPHLVRLKRLLDSGDLGAIHRARLFYGNGTARDVRQSAWRDRGLGVLGDLGSHLLDLTLFLFGKPTTDFVPWELNCFENRAFDHVMLGNSPLPPAPSPERKGGARQISLVLEATLLSWRNTFSVDVLAERGSAHIHGLCKWGPSTLTVRRRVLPSGRPPEKAKTLECPDPTWTMEYEHFKRLCRVGGSNLENDLWINAVLGELARTVEGRLVA